MFLNKPKRCPPFCNNYCPERHHKLIISLLQVQENDKKSLEKFRYCVSNYYRTLRPEDPIPDPIRDYRYPLLHWAGVLGKTSAVEFLIERGHPADLKSSDKGESVMHRVVYCLLRTMSSHRLDAVKRRFKSLTEILSYALFVADDNGNTPMHACAVYITELDNKTQVSFYLRALEIMIDKVIEVEEEKSLSTDVLNMQNRDGNTMLHLLASCKDEEGLGLAQKLIDHKAKTDLWNCDGKSAIDIAANNSKRMYKMLLQFQRKKRKLSQDAVISNDPVSSSAEEMTNNACVGGDAEKAMVLDQNCVSSTSIEDLNNMYTSHSDLQPENSISVHTEGSKGTKRRKTIPKKLEIKPTLVSDDKQDPSIILAKMAQSSTSGEDTATPEAGGTLDNLPSSPRIHLGTLSADQCDKLIQPNLVRLLKQVGQEKPVLEVVQKSKMDLEEKIEQSTKTLKDYKAEQEKCVAESAHISEEIEAKRKELEVLTHKLTKEKDKIADLKEKLADEKSLQMDSFSELAIYNEIFKCLGSE